MSSQLFPVAAGVIPTRIALYVQQGLHRPLPYLVNISVSIAVVVVTLAGWVAALHASISGGQPSHFWRVAIYLALILPTLGIVSTIADGFLATLKVFQGTARPASVWLKLECIEKKLERIESKLP